MINSCSSNVSFTSVIPTKVFINGAPTGDEKNIKKAIRALGSVLRNPKTNTDALVKKTLAQKDFDFNYNFNPNEYGYMLTSFMEKKLGVFRTFILTGRRHAGVIKEIGKKIGKPKKESKQAFGTPYSVEVQELTRNYHKVLNDFISNPKNRIKTIIDRVAKKYEGDALEMHIHTKKKPNKTNKNFSLQIEGITFEPVQNTNLKQVVSKKAESAVNKAKKVMGQQLTLNL